jgi:hypothetical protein
MNENILPGLLTEDMGDGLLDYQRPYASRPPRSRAGPPRRYRWIRPRPPAGRKWL